MRSLAQTTSRIRATHRARTIKPVAHKSTLASKPRPSQPPAISDPLSPDADEAPQKRYARLPDPPTFSLSQAKLRALIDLYHSSSTFITPESLSAEIDKAFTPIRFNQAPVRPESYQDLVQRRNERAAEPDRVVPTANEMEGKYATFDTLSDGWSASKSERARLVKGALWGVDPLGKIGLETLLEAKAEMDQFKESEGKETSGAEGEEKSKEDSEKSS